MKTLIQIIILLSIANILINSSCTDKHHKAICDAPISLIDSGIIVLTIYQSDCDICYTLLEDSIYTTNRIPKINLDVTENGTNNKRIAQALWNYGFPTSYFIDSNYNIIGITQGIDEFAKYTDSICNFNVRYHDNEIVHFGIQHDSVLSLLSNSLKSLYAYSHGQMQKAKEYALLSLRSGTYFFNNYILYNIYESESQKDSAQYYKRAALKHNSSVDQYMYHDLIDDL